MTDNLKKECPYYNPDCPQCYSTNKTTHQEPKEKCGCIDFGETTKENPYPKYCEYHLGELLKSEREEKQKNKIYKDYSGILSDKKIEETIQYLNDILKSQRAELIEEIEGMKKEDEHSKNCSLAMSPCESCAEEFAYNQALEDVLTKLKNK